MLPNNHSEISLCYSKLLGREYMRVEGNNRVPNWHANVCQRTERLPLQRGRGHPNSNFDNDFPAMEIDRTFLVRADP